MEQAIEKNRPAPVFSFTCSAGDILRTVVRKGEAGAATESERRRRRELWSVNDKEKPFKRGFFYAKMAEMKEEDKKNEEENTDESEVLEFEFNEDGEEDLKKTIKKLRADIKELRKEKEEYLTGWQKERANFANYKKNEEDRLASYKESLREHILTRFLTVMDSFNIAFSNKEVWEKVDLNWRIGIQHIYSQLTTIFEEHGVKELGKAGEPFDPNIHHSVETVETDKKEFDHKVAAVIQKGYKMGERVLRPARVNVYEYKRGE